MRIVWCDAKGAATATLVGRDEVSFRSFKSQKTQTKIQNKTKKTNTRTHNTQKNKTSVSLSSSEQHNATNHFSVHVSFFYVDNITTRQRNPHTRSWPACCTDAVIQRTVIANGQIAGGDDSIQCEHGDSVCAIVFVVVRWAQNRRHSTSGTDALLWTFAVDMIYSQCGAGPHTHTPLYETDRVKESCSFLLLL
jgi:hypothetical protein